METRERRCARTVSYTHLDVYKRQEGAGAAGGLGFAFLSYLDAELTPGIELILDAVGLEEEVKDADVVVTGEGRLDHQTAMGLSLIHICTGVPLKYTVIREKAPRLR